MARPFARSATTTAYFQPQLTAGPGGRLAFALPVRTGQASAMPSMKQGNPPDSGFGAITARSVSSTPADNQVTARHISGRSALGALAGCACLGGSD